MVDPFTIEERLVEGGCVSAARKQVFFLGEELLPEYRNA
jgi:hypothetical protein